MFTGIIQSIGKLKQEKNIIEIESLDNLFDMAIGDSVNLEADALIKYVEKLLLFNKNSNQDLSSNNISSEWLKENGW